MHIQSSNSIYKNCAESEIVVRFFGSTIDCAARKWVWSQITKATAWCKVSFCRYFKWICLLSLHFPWANFSLKTFIVQVNNCINWGFLHSWAFILHHSEHFDAIHSKIGWKTPYHHFVLCDLLLWIRDGRTFPFVRFSRLVATYDDWVSSSRCFHSYYDYPRSLGDDKLLAVGNGPTPANSHSLRHLQCFSCDWLGNRTSIRVVYEWKVWVSNYSRYCSNHVSLFCSFLLYFWSGDRGYSTNTK